MKNQINSKGLSRRKFVGVLGGGVVFIVSGWRLLPEFINNEKEDYPGQNQVLKDKMYQLGYRFMKIIKLPFTTLHLRWVRAV